MTRRQSWTRDLDFERDERKCPQQCWRQRQCSWVESNYLGPAHLLERCGGRNRIWGVITISIPTGRTGQAERNSCAIIRYPVAVSECCTGVSVVGQSSSTVFFISLGARAADRPRSPRLGCGVLKDAFPIRWSPWARFLPVQLIRSAWQSAWHINFPRTRCVSPMTPDHYYAVVDRMLCMR